MATPMLEVDRIRLHDGRHAKLRPLAPGDRAALLAFGRALPQDDLQYLEDDFSNAEVVNRLINMCAAEHWRQIVASIGDAVVGYAAIRRLPGWSSHVGAIHLVVSGGWRRVGLGSALADTMLRAADDLGVQQAIVEMLEEQYAGRAIFERLGFAIEGMFNEHVRDREGQRHNLLVLGYQCIEPL